MAFGFKVKKLKCANAYTIQEFYEKIKDVKFEAGVPELVKYGISTSIVFPALNSQNQVQIMAFGFKKQTQSFSVQKGQELAVKSAAKNIIMSEITDGYSNLGSGFGNVVKECERLVDETYNKLVEMNL